VPVYVADSVVVAVSDTAATSGPSHDLSGPHIRSLIDQHPSYIVGSYAIVRDDPVAIRLQVKEWAEASGDNRVDWIITTGGTGFGERDQTPQVRRTAACLLQFSILIRGVSVWF
jgi:gephyrin